jgi:hypothetical protein
MAKLQDFTLDPKNANKHSEFGTGLLENSLRDLGAGRSALATNDNVIIAGNGVAEACRAIGLEKVKIVETDGNELVIVKRKDLNSKDVRAIKMALADNIVAQKNIVMDGEVVESIAQDYPEAQFWTSIVLKEEGQGDTEKADLVTMKFELSSRQYAKVKAGMKLAKQIFKEKFQEGENENEQGNCLFHIMNEFLKNHK